MNIRTLIIIVLLVIAVCLQIAQHVKKVHEPNRTACFNGFGKCHIEMPWPSPGPELVRFQDKLKVVANELDKETPLKTDNRVDYRW